MPDDLHEALIALRRASSRAEIDAALTDVLGRVAPMLKFSLRMSLAPAESLVGPHRTVAEVEDLLQEAGIQIWRWLPSYRGRTPGEAEAWVRKIAHNLAVDTVKTSFRRDPVFWKPSGLFVMLKRTTKRSTSPDDQELPDGISD